MKERLAQILEDYRIGAREFPTYQELIALLDDGVSAAPHAPKEAQ